MIIDKPKRNNEGRIKRFKLKENEIYFNEYSKTISPTSLTQYKSAINRLESLTSKDLMMVTVEEIQGHLNTFDEGNTKRNQERYIVAFMRFMRFIISNYAEQAVEKANKETVYWLMDEVNRKLMQVLIEKNK